MLFDSAVERSDLALLEFPCVAVAALACEERTSVTDESLRMRADELELLLDRARDEGRDEARAEFDERLRESVEVERTAIAHACVSFAHVRERYFADVEREVVRLALAIAGRILQREVAMDAALLAGVVRVALSKLGDKEGTVLHVPKSELQAWQRAMAAGGLSVAVDETLPVGELRLEAAGGAVELGIKAQLAEIEHGFFDLLARRPA